tara:strand:+ start:983 stop:2287 length:1305 start_codon:yes stop_codon:yes gene_type:complete
MKRYENILNLLSKKYYSIKNKFFKKTIREGQTNMDCSKNYFHDGTDCVKEIDTVKIFFQTPIANSFLIFGLTYLFAALLFKIKSSPLALSKSGLSCTNIPMSKIFKGNALEGMVHETIYTNKTDKEKFSKILFPKLDKEYYPNNALQDGNTFDIMYLAKLPLFISLQFCTLIFISPISAIKKLLYKHNQWGTIPEISKINKESWWKDLVTIFVFIPLLLLFIFPLGIMASLIFTTIFSPMISFCRYILPNKDFKIRGGRLAESASPFDKAKVYAWTVGSCFCWFVIYLIAGMVYSVYLFLLFIYWMLRIMAGLHETKRDGLKTIFKTWANIIWDYKYIWALLAIAMWSANFSIYLKGKKNILKFIDEEKTQMIPGIVVGVACLLLGLQQMKFYKFLPKKLTQRKNCHPNCNPPAMSAKETGVTKECPASKKTVV